jgi:UDP-glucose 4-epimerase
MRNILICGSTGPVSNLLQKTLLDSNCKIYVIGRDYFSKNKNISSDCNIKDIHFSDIFFLISSLKVSIDSEMSDLSSLPELDMLSLIFKTLKFNRLIYFSSSGAVYGSSNQLITELSPRLPVSNYGKSKLLIEDYIVESSRDNKLNYLILRISNPYGIYSSILFNYGLIPAIFNCCFAGSDLLIYTDVQFRKDYIGVDLLSLIFSRILYSPDASGIYNIGSGQSFSIIELIELIESKTNRFINTIEIEGIKSIDTDIARLDVSKFINDFNIKYTNNFVNNIDLMAKFYWSNFNDA